MISRAIGIFLITSLLLTSSCSVRKFIPEEELLYTGADLEITSDTLLKNKKALRTQLKELITPEPNSRVLSTRFGLYFHYKAQQDDPGFITRFLNRKFGEEPVYLSDADPFQTADIIENRLENRGLFYSQVSHSINRYENKGTAEIHYKAEIASVPYTMARYEVEEDSLVVYQEIREIMTKTLLKPGMPFDLAVMKAERERIDESLKRRGFYNFSPNFLLFKADTNRYDKRKFDLFLGLKKDVPKAGIRPYIIKTINVYPNHVLGQDSISMGIQRYNGKNYVQEEVFFEPKKLDPFILLREGERYDPIASGRTSRRLSSIGVYKIVNIRYTEVDSLATDSLGYLVANIFLSPMNKRAIRAEIQAVTKSNNFAGPHFALTYSNRNLFQGGEILKLSGKIGYERQLSSGSETGMSSMQLGAMADLIYPRMLFPVAIGKDWIRYSIPKTRISMGVETLSRSQLFRLFSVNGSFGYIWRVNRYITHELDPFSINYVKLTHTTTRFEDILTQNPFLESSFEQQFIAGLTYSFIYNGMVDMADRHQFFLNTNFDLSGNTLDLLSRGETPKKFLGLEFAQYVKLDADFRYHLRVGSRQKIATRFFAGIGIPYGNSEVLPFSRQFFAGGPYSIRAFRIRGLGPGTYHPEGDDLAQYDQMGNIRLEANLEYRFPIFRFLNGALFTDAGNVWNTHQSNLLPGGQFSKDFLKEFGVGVGAGLRIDIQSFVIRFDLAVPARIPWLPEGERWKIQYREPVLNFAIGYPF